MAVFDPKIYLFKKKEAGRVVRFCEKFLVHVKGEKEGQPFKLEQFQKDLFTKAEGWYHKKNDRLKHRYVWFEVPKGNGKSMLLSGLALYKCCCGIKNGEIYVAAGDKEQARIVFDSCKLMIEASPALAGKFTVLKDKIIHKKSNSFIQVLSAEAYTKHGYRPYCIIFDELHVQKNRELWDTLVRGLMKIKNSQCWVITTAGYTGTFYETMHNYAEALIKGTLKDDTWLPIIYKANLPKDEKKAAKYIWTKKAWKEANPGWKNIIDPFDFEVMAQSCRNVPSERDAFKRLNLNLMTGGANAWDVVDEWHKCNKYKIDEKKLHGLICYGGLDLGATRDMSSLVLKFPDTGDILPFFWIPKDTAIKRSLGENINFLNWVEDGFVKVTPGNVQDYDVIFEDIKTIVKNYQVGGIGYDRWRATQLVINLKKEGLPLNPFGQGFASMHTPTVTVEKNIVSGIYNHGGNPVLTWQIGNVVLDKNAAGDVKPNKARSKDKIDGIVSMIMAEGEHLTGLANGAGSLDENYELTVF